jgi:serine/threonine protein kinase
MSEHPVTGAWSATPGARPAESPTVPGYEILEELGRGGMGVVYKARQVSLKRLVALKMIRDGALAGPQEAARFRIEAEAAARMRHPNTVQIHEIGEHGGRPFFAMELVEGGSLDKYLAGRPQPAPWSAELVRTLAGAVQHAHEQRVIHRDLKPANILLSFSGRSQNGGGGAAPFCERPLNEAAPKISDFGLAKRLDAQSTAWTREGAVIGTAGYMAPEQAAGRVRDVGPAVDVYALGAILYELLTGRPPFQGDSWEQMVLQVLQEEPAPPTQLRADVPHDLETICLKCLEKEPPRRYASARELADDLGRFLEGRPVAAVPLSAAERLARLAGQDGYRILGEVGRGPWAVVYRARDDRLGRPVALKVFPAGACTRPEWEARLRPGAELWAALTHPHLVAVHRAGWWDGAPYLALEYVPHGSLAARMAGRPQPVGQALRLVEQLAEVVGYLHRQGVVHGNLKPANVLLAADGIPRITDFRLAGGLFHGSPPAEGTDRAGLAYLAPELLDDPGAEPRFNPDIYGLGMILYELLTGRPPFTGADAREVLEQVRAQEPVGPSRLNPGVSVPLEQFCLRCLRKNPWRRPARAYDVLTQLRRFRDELEGGPDGRRHKHRPPGPEGL